MVIVAQLVRALVCGAGGRGFESHQSPIKKKGVDIKSTPFLFKWVTDGIRTHDPRHHKPVL